MEKCTCLVVNFAVDFAAGKVPPNTHSRQSDGSTFLVPWPRLVPIPTFLLLAARLSKQDYDIFVLMSGENNTK